MDRLRSDLNDRPESTIESLKTFCEGLRWIIKGFRDLIDVLQCNGSLETEDVEFAIRLFGVAPTRERMTQDVMAYVVNLYNLGCTPGVSPAVIADWLEEAHRPDVMRGIPDDEVIGDADENRELLVETFEEEIKRLRAEERRIWVEVDQPSLAAALNRVSILTEDAAKRVARSHSEARTTFHRATKDLWPLLERDKENGPPRARRRRR